MKILIILTGGTIGSAVTDGYISLNSKAKNTLLADFPHIDFTVIEPYNILSEQLNGEHLNLLVDSIKSNLSSDFDGIIITHGTDTLQYTACGLSCVFPDIDIPVILVSSNYVLGDERANGKDNFKYAIEFIKEKIGGIFVSYKNSGSKSEIHQGHKVLPHEIYSDDVKSIEGSLGYFENNKFIQTAEYEPCKGADNSVFSTASCVLWQKIHPEMIYPDSENYKAILLESYHSGTSPTYSDNFRNFCQNSNNPVYLVGAKEGPQYDSVKEYQELNIKHLPFISPIYAYMKLWLDAEI